MLHEGKLTNCRKHSQKLQITSTLSTSTHPLLRWNPSNIIYGESKKLFQGHFTVFQV